MRDDVKNLIYLVSCAIHSTTPDTDRVSGLNYDALWALASAHSLTSCVAVALEKSAPFKEKTVDEAVRKKWSKAYYMALTKELQLDAERKAILEFMESNGIRYAPLKGIIIKDLYPKRGMREMSDNDILFDANHAEKMRGYMENRGYRTESFEEIAHDTYLKEPVYNFELHRVLFAKKDEPLFFEYYKDLRSRLKKDADNTFGYHFSDEDFYIYTVAHANRHYRTGGTGFKTFADNFLFLNKKDLDRKYVDRELKKTGLFEYERELSDMSRRLFLEPDNIFSERFDFNEEHWLYDTEISGSYGSVKSFTFRKMYEIAPGKNRMDKSTKWKYMLGRLFPKPEYIRKSYPLSDKLPILVPYFYVHRIVRNAVLKRNMIQSEITSANEVLKQDNLKK